MSVHPFSHWLRLFTDRGRETSGLAIYHEGDRAKAIIWALQPMLVAMFAVMSALQTRREDARFRTREPEWLKKWVCFCLQMA